MMFLNNNLQTKSQILLNRKKNAFSFSNNKLKKIILQLTSFQHKNYFIVDKNIF